MNEKQVEAIRETFKNEEKTIWTFNCQEGFSRLSYSFQRYVFLSHQKLI